MTMILAEITISTEAMVVVGGVCAFLASGITFLFMMLTGNRTAELASLKESYERQLTSLTSDRNSWREMSEESVNRLDQAVAAHRKASHKPGPAVKPLAKIIPEHSSPITPQQQETADIATVRARLVAATLALGLEARKAPPPANGKMEAGAAIADAASAIGVASEKIDVAADSLNKQKSTDAKEGNKP